MDGARMERRRISFAHSNLRFLSLDGGNEMSDREFAHFIIGKGKLTLSKVQW